MLLSVALNTYIIPSLLNEYCCTDKTRTNHRNSYSGTSSGYLAIVFILQKGWVGGEERGEIKLLAKKICHSIATMVLIQQLNLLLLENQVAYMNNGHVWFSAHFNCHAPSKYQFYTSPCSRQVNLT